MKNRNKIFEKMKLKKDINNNIPEEIKMLFGRFYAYSLLYIVVLYVLFPFIIINYVNYYFSIGVVIILFLLYLYIVYDVIKHKEKFNSSLFPLALFFVIIGFTVSIYKLF